MTGDPYDGPPRRQPARPPRPAPPSLPREAAPSAAPDRLRGPRPSPGAHQDPRATRVPAASAIGTGAALRPAPSGGLAAGVLGAIGAAGRAVGRGRSPFVVAAVVDRAAADRQLVVGAVTVLFLARIVDGPTAWFVAITLGLGVLLGAGWSRVSAADAADASSGGAASRGRWESVVGGAAGIESGIVPAVLAASLALALRLVPFDWWLVVALGVAFLLINRTIALERSLAVSISHEGDRWKATLAVLMAAFIGFAGVASMVDGALGGPGSQALDEGDLLLLAGADALVAALLGFRLARLGPASRREAVFSGAGFGAVVALGAGLLRAMAIPQLLGPALLTLLVYLWDALNATTPSIRRDPRWRWQMGLLLVLSVVVIGWNLQLRR